MRMKVNKAKLIGQHGYVMASILILGTALSIISIAIFDYANNSRVVLELELYQRMAGDAAQSGVEDTIDKLYVDDTYAGIQAPPDCTAVAGKAPIIVQEPLFCSTYSVQEVAPGQFLSTGLVYRKTGATYKQVSRYVFTANIPSGSNPPSGGGGGTAGGPLNTMTTTVAPGASGASSAVINGDYVYLIGGGINESYSTRVIYAKIEANGSINSWITTTSLPEARSEGAAVVANGRIYYTGGRDDSTSVVYASINADGSVGPWTEVADSTYDNLFGHSMVERNGVIYVIGGFYGFSNNNDRISRATVNANGTLGSWTHQTGWFSDDEKASQHSSLIYNDRLYVAGKGEMRRASFNANGSVATPTISTLPIMNKFPNHGLVQMNNYFYIAGGHLGGTDFVRQDDVYYAPINTDGSPGTWVQQSNLLPDERSYTAVITKNNRIYIINGSNNDTGNGQSSVFVGTSN